jgi:hypothetical protein
MKMHLRYLWYVLRHKWFVFVECVRLGIPWAGVIHDWQKFTRAEWNPYALTFYGPYARQDRPAWLVEAFARAWKHHVRHGPHHWQHWLIVAGEYSECVLMPDRYIREMIADWYGAGRSNGAKVSRDDRYAEVRVWYSKQRNQIRLHPVTRHTVERMIGWK